MFVLVRGMVVGNGRVLGATPPGDKKKVFSRLRSRQNAKRIASADRIRGTDSCCERFQDVLLLIVDRLHDLAVNKSVLVKAINGAEPMVTVCDDDLAVDLITNEEQWRERLASANLFAVFFHMGIADAEQ